MICLSNSTDRAQCLAVALLVSARLPISDRGARSAAGGPCLWCSTLGFVQRALGCNRDVSINRIDEQHVGRAAAVVLATALLLWKRMRNHGSSFKQAKSVANLDFKWFSVSASNKDRVQTGKPYLEAATLCLIVILFRLDFFRNSGQIAMLGSFDQIECLFVWRDES